MAVGFQRPGLFGMGRPPMRAPVQNVAPAAGLGVVPKPAEPFLWGAGGTRMTAEQVEQMRAMAAAEMADAGSGAPVGHWLQGLNRSLGAVTGGLRMRRADKADAAIQAESDAVVDALMADPTNKGLFIKAAASGRLDKNVAGLLAKQFEPEKPIEPVIKQMNNGDYVGLHPLTGEVLFTRVDPNPKPNIDWITADNGDGTKQLIPIGPNGPITGGGGQASGAAPAAPPATLPADFFDDDKPQGGAGASRIGSNFLDGL